MVRTMVLEYVRTYVRTCTRVRTYTRVRTRVPLCPIMVLEYTCVTIPVPMVRSSVPWYVLREAMQALWRVQAHMLARIVVEIRAADIAVELEPQL